jgi:hypothetical protein
MAGATETTPFSEIMVYYDHPLSNTHGIPVIIKGPLIIPRRCTLGFVRIGKELFGMTVAHALVAPPENNWPSADDDGDMEFSLEYDSASEDDEDENFIGATSRGELSISLDNWNEC